MAAKSEILQSYTHPRYLLYATFLLHVLNVEKLLAWRVIRQSGFTHLRWFRCTKWKQFCRSAGAKLLRTLFLHYSNTQKLRSALQLRQWLVLRGEAGTGCGPHAEGTARASGRSLGVWYLLYRKRWHFIMFKSIFETVTWEPVPLPSGTQTLREH